MSRKKILICFLICLCYTFSQAQVGEINQKAKDNQKSKSENRSSNSSNSGDGGGFFANLFIDILQAIFSRSPEQRAQARLMRSELRQEGILNPYLSLDVAMDYGTVPNFYQSIRTRLRGKIGAFSSEVRYGNLLERKIDKTESYATLDWQIVQLWILNFQSFSWRVGIGSMHEYTTRTTFMEYTNAFESVFAQKRIRLSPEIRYSYDYATNVSPRFEFNAELSYALIQKPHFKLFTGISMMYGKYYESTKIWTTGLHARIKID